MALEPLLVLAMTASAVQNHRDLPRLKREVTAVCKRFRGRMGFYFKDLSTGQAFGYRESERFPSASTIKTVVMIEAFRQIEEGKLKWTDSLSLPPKTSRSESIWAYHLAEGAKLNVEGLVTLMMNVSDNTATVMLSERLGVENIERRLLGWGFKDTACTIRVPASNQRLTRLRQTFANMGVTTPREMGQILELIYRKRAASPAACERMIRIMSHQYWDDFFASQFPPSVVVCSKVGALQRSRSDTAIVYAPHPFILTAYTDHAADRSWKVDTEGHRFLREVARLVWRHSNPQWPYTPPAGSEQWFPTGAGLE